jgi:hypothetical protein
MLTATVPATAEQGGSSTPGAAATGAAAHNAGHDAGPPAANGSDRAPEGQGERPLPAAVTRHGALRTGDGSPVEPGINPLLDRRSKLGVPAIDRPDVRLAPAGSQFPRIGARERLLRLIQTAKPRPPVRLRPPNFATPSLPTRNAIGVRIDAGAPARTALVAHWGQPPARRPTAVPTSVAQSWHPAVVAPAVPTRGALNGTVLVRVGSGTTVIGGPAKSAGVINGTTLRPKHQ